MFKMVKTAFLLVFLANFYMFTIKGEEEFCISEIFNPRCSGPDEVIVIEEAHFGRKSIGRCLKDEEVMDGINVEDKRFLGCYSDVKHLVSPKCSGKTFCEVRVAELPAPKQCFNLLRSYLGVSFKCIKMVQSNRQCLINLVDSEPQHLFLKYNANSCGSIGHLWTIEALTGQRIQSTLIDFSKSAENGQDRLWHQRPCYAKLGHIYDRISNDNITLCAPRHNNSTLLFVHQSKSNTLEIGFEASVKGDPQEFYVIKLQATGCSDLIPPADAWLKRTENEATIGCYSTRLRWQLKCQGQRWIGVIGNCSQGVGIILNTKNSVEKKEASLDNQAVIIFGIIIMGVVICLLIGCLGIVLMKRYYAMNKLKAVTRLASADHQQSGMFHNTFNGTLIKCNGDAPNGKIGNETFQDVSYYQDDGSNSLLKNPAHYFELDRNANQNNV